MINKNFNGIACITVFSHCISFHALENKKCVRVLRLCASYDASR